LIVELKVQVMGLEIHPRVLDRTRCRQTLPKETAFFKSVRKCFFICFVQSTIELEARGGIEPPLKALQAPALPLGYRARERNAKGLSTQPRFVSERYGQYRLPETKEKAALSRTQQKSV
jgi:hypothetical protein